MLSRNNTLISIPPARTIFFIFALLCVAGVAGTAAADISKVTGKMDRPEYSYDGNPETAAALSRNPGEKQFVIYIHLAETAAVESIALLAYPAPESAEISASDDVVSWKQVPCALHQLPEGEYNRIEVTAQAPFPAQFIKLKLGARDAQSLRIHEISIVESPTGENEIADIAVESIAETGAVIRYRTRLPAATQVRYGIGRPVFNLLYVVRERVQEHIALMDYLKPGTEYYYQIVLDDAGGKVKTSDVRSFRTAGAPPLQIKSIRMPRIEPSGAVIAAEANLPATWEYKYGVYADGAAAADDPGGWIKPDSTPATEKEIVITDLVPRTRYFIMLRATDSAGTTIVGTPDGFDTPPVNLALGRPVSGTFNFELEDKYIERVSDPMARATDGDLNYHTGFTKSHPTSEGDQWLAVDLGEIKTIGEIVVVWSALAVPENYEISTSRDENRWETTAAVTGPWHSEAASVRNLRSQRGDPLTEVTFAADREARFVRLSIPAGTRVTSGFGFSSPILAEIMVLEPPRN